jgi:acetylornithine deacetylase/succinyl-diaminopimelate desuccinylase-like protein
MPSQEERMAVAAARFDRRLVELGFDSSDFGEPGYTSGERVALRPTLELNGLGAGFQGEGIKTVIPSEARAKVSCRLVPDQTPAHILEALREHVEHQCPPGVEVEVVPLGGAARPYRIPPDDRWLHAATLVLKELYGQSPVQTHAGASLPITGTFRAELGAGTIFFAFSLDDENIHGPNEFFRVASFERAQRAYCLLYEQLGSCA